jgi:rod shape-determining protein MreB and related proteins
MLATSDLGIDLGTANTLIHVRGRGIVVNEPSIVAVRRKDHSVLAVGHEAKAMLGRTPDGVVAIRPLKAGVIADFDAAQKMLHALIDKAGIRRSLRRPRILISVPSAITQVQRRAVSDAVTQAGGRDVYLIEQPVAAAVGAGLPIDKAGGNLIVDIGGGTTDVAVISLSGIVHSTSTRIAGDEMDEVIVQYIKKHYNLLVGERRVEELKINLGAPGPRGSDRRMVQVKGQYLIAGTPKTIEIAADELRDVLQESVLKIVDTVRTCLEQTPPEMAADMVDNGIVVTGGGALLCGIQDVLQKETYLPVTVAENPLGCIATGLGRLLDDVDLLKKVALPH